MHGHHGRREVAVEEDVAAAAVLGVGAQRQLLDERPDAVVLGLVQQLLHVDARDHQGARPQVVQDHLEQLGVPGNMEGLGCHNKPGR